MLFTSYEFIGFLTLLVILYYLVPGRLQTLLLLAGSLAFYAFSGPANLVFLAISILSVYFCAILIGRTVQERKAYIKEHRSEMSAAERKAYSASMKRRETIFFVIGLAANVLMLSAFKFGGSLAGWLLPLGMSFYVFTVLGYLIDVYREKYEPETSFVRFALFASFFPQLIQGPINRYDDMARSLYDEHRFDPKAVSYGLERILWGYFKKLVVADRILPAVKVLIGAPDTYDGVFVFIAMVLYALQLYADFTGGIDITIGIAEMLGIGMKENFERPFFSKNLAEYWRRWHISLGTWFTDYVFYPVSVSGFMMKMSGACRKSLPKVFGSKAGTYLAKRTPVYISSLAVWFLTGIWHGTGANFIVWGLLNGIILIASQELEPVYAAFHKVCPIGWKRGTYGKGDASVHFVPSRAYDGFQALRTVFITSSLRMLDLYRDVPLTFKMLGTMFTRPRFERLLAAYETETVGAYSGIPNIIETLSGILGLSGADMAIAAIAVIIMLMVSLKQRGGSIREKLAARPAAVRYAVFGALFVLIVIFGAYGVGYDASQFIYNQF